MTLNRFFRRALPMFLIVLCVTMETIVHAEVKIFIGVGEYIMNDFEHSDIAKQRAQQNAELDAVKRAAAYIKNFSDTLGIVINDDEISAVATNTITFGDIKIESVANDLSEVNYKATLKAQINTNAIYDFINRNDKEKVEIINSNKRRWQAIRKNDAIAKIVKVQYNHAISQTEKDILRNQMKTINLEFLSNRKSQESNKFFYIGDKDGGIRQAIEASEFDTQIIEEYHKWSIPDFDKAIELDPDNTNAYRLRGVAYNNLGQNDQALQDLNKAIELNSNDISAHYNRGIAYYNLKQYEQAVQDFNQAIKFYPYSRKVFAYYDRGMAYYKLEQYERAIQDFDKAIELEPNYTKTYNARALCYIELKQHNLAIVDFNKAIEFNPNNAVLYFNRGFAYFELAQPPKGTFKNFDKVRGECALENFTKAIKLNPNYADAYDYRGACYFELGKYRLAVKDFTKTIELDPNYTDAYFGRGWSYCILNRYKKAIADFNKYIEFVPDNAEAYRLRGYCYSALGDMEKMSADFEKYDELSSKS